MGYVKLTDMTDEARRKVWYAVDYYMHKMWPVTDPDTLELLKKYDEGKYTVIPPLKPGEEPRF